GSSRGWFAEPQLGGILSGVEVGLDGRAQGQTDLSTAIGLVEPKHVDPQARAGLDRTADAGVPAQLGPRERELDRPAAIGSAIVEPTGGPERGRPAAAPAPQPPA